MILRLQRLISRYVPENASWHAAKPGYWLIAYLYNTDNDEDGYLRYHPGQLEVIEADDEKADRELGRAEAQLELLPAFMYLAGAVVFSGAVSGTVGFLLTLTFLALAWLSTDQIGEMAMEVEQA